MSMADENTPDIASGEATAEQSETVGAEIDDLKNKILRLQADFDNFRKRSSRVRGEAAEDTRREMFSQFLGVYDNFMRALDQAESSPELRPFLDGFELIRQQFEQVFGQQGLESIPAGIGESFDPNVHEAMGMMPPGMEGEPGTIGHLVQSGFTYKGQVVRPAKVMVFPGA